jgi:hypothetical protein
MDLFCLHYVYLPRINAALAIFAEEWNNHSLRTEQNATPKQLFYGGMIEHGIQSSSTEGDININTEYGVDWDGPVAEGEEEDEDGYNSEQRQVIVLPPNCPLSLQEFHHLQSLIDPLTEDNMYGINVFQWTHEVVEMIIMNRAE